MNNKTEIYISSNTIVKIIAWVVLFAGLFYISDIIIAILVAIVLSSSVKPVIRLLCDYKIPRGFAVLILFTFLIAIFATIAFLFIPPLADDVAKFIKTLPSLLDSIRLFGSDMGFKDLSQTIAQLSKDISKGQILTTLKNIFFGGSGFFATTSIFVTGVFHVVLTLVLSFYLAAERRGAQRFLKIFVHNSHEEYVEDIWNRSQKKIALWMQGQLLLSLFVALMVYVPMLILNIPYASLLAILAFIGELIPVIGLTLAMLPAVLLAFVTGGASLFWIVLGVYFVIGQIESHILYPNIMNRLVGVPSVIVIIALVIGAKLAGFWGVLLAVPIAAVIMEMMSDLEKRKRNNYVRK